MKLILACLPTLIVATSLFAQELPSPIIDMHLNAPQIGEFEQLAGPAPIPHCIPMTDYPIPESGSQWLEVFRSRELECDAIWSPATDDEYLRWIVKSGFGKRVMFGSDQMVWPDAIELAIETIESGEFLTEEQKRDIFYNNAARFLRLSNAEISRHHATPGDGGIKAD